MCFRIESFRGKIPLSVLLFFCFNIDCIVIKKAPGTARGPNTDLTDFYMFKTKRNNVAFVMNLAGLTQSQSGPNYTPLSNDFVYQIHVDNDGDAKEDLTFQFVTGFRYVNNGIFLFFFFSFLFFFLKENNRSWHRDSDQWSADSDSCCTHCTRRVANRT